jgi:Flp pilus assembly protein TadD
MLVSQPFVMLLLDRWPLGRSPHGGSAWRNWLPLVREKLPYFGLAAISCAVTFVAQKRGGAVSSVEVVPWANRLGNAAVSYAAYLEKTLWPSKLSVFYPLDLAGPERWRIVVSVVWLGVVTWICLASFSRRPWLGIGWLWYLGTLIPVVGIVQVGNQSMADRYTYWPMVGFSIVVAFGAAEFLGRSPARATLVRALAVASLAACLLLTRRQVALWKDDLTLFGHAAAVTKNNALAHYRLGHALELIGRDEEALTQYRESLRIRPGYADPYNNVGMVLEKAGATEEAVEKYRWALHLDPKLHEARANLANALDTLGRSAEAEREMREALEQKPEMPEAHNDFGVMLAKQNRLEEAIRELREAIALKRGYVDAHMNLAKALYMHGRKDEATENLREVLRLDPGHEEARTTLEEVIALEKKAGADPRAP